MFVVWLEVMLSGDIDDDIFFCVCFYLNCFIIDESKLKLVVWFLIWLVVSEVENIINDS